MLLFPFGSRAARAVDPRAAGFASRGFAETIAVCRLPKTCANKPPRSARSEPIRETGNDNIVEEHFVRFDGLEISFLFVLGNAAEPSPTHWKKGKPYPPPYVTNLKITSGNWPVQRNLRIGTSRALSSGRWGRLSSTTAVARGCSTKRPWVTSYSVSRKIGYVRSSGHLGGTVEAQA